MRKVTEITDKKHPGFGFFSVEGVDGFHREDVATRIARQMDAKPAEAEAPSSAPIDEKDFDSTTCPSCGHHFKLSAMNTVLGKASKMILRDANAEADDIIEAASKKAGALIADAEEKAKAATAQGETPPPGSG